LRIMSLDFGTKRIGVAVSDELLITAQGLGTIERASADKDMEKIALLASEHGVSEIVVGLPVNMNGTHSQKTAEALKFVEGLSKAVAVPVKTWDERLTTVQAERAMLQADMSRAKRRRLADKIAAQLILQSYLDSRKR